MMNNDELKKERLQILKMVKDGTITAEEAARLLAALEASVTTTVLEKVPTKHAFRMIKIQIDTTDGERVRVQVPVEFAKLLKSQRFSGVELKDFDLDVDQIITIINSGIIGEIINIESSDATIKIYVE